MNLCIHCSLPTSADPCHLCGESQNAEEVMRLQRLLLNRMFSKYPSNRKTKNMSLRIYVASSWRNTIQPEVVEHLRSLGHSVYDFRTPNSYEIPPTQKGPGFSWSEIDPNWQSWTPEEYRAALQHPIARRGYLNDVDALEQCDVCLLVLPSGRSASWELGYAMGMHKPGVVLQIGKVEPELMYREARIIASMEELKALFSPGGAYGVGSAFDLHMSGKRVTK